MRVGIATDHGGFGLKQEMITRLCAAGHEIVDFGAHRLTPSDDYPDFVIPLAHAIAAGRVERGVAICGSGRPDGGTGSSLGPRQDVPDSRVQSSRAAPAPACQSRFPAGFVMILYLGIESWQSAE